MKRTFQPEVRSSYPTPRTDSLTSLTLTVNSTVDPHTEATHNRVRVRRGIYIYGEKNITNNSVQLCNVQSVLQLGQVYQSPTTHQQSALFQPLVLTKLKEKQNAPMEKANSDPTTRLGGVKRKGKCVCVGF